MDTSILFLVSASVLLLSTFGNSTAFKEDCFVVEPEKGVYVKEGSNVTLEWQFNIGQWPSSPIGKVAEFLFGYWEPPGFVQHKILAVHYQNVVSKQRGFESKVDWSGDIDKCVKCTAIIRFYNLTDADFKTYGVEVEPVDLRRIHLASTVTLAKFAPAEIIKWPPKVIVEERKATTVECKATGRPTPSVIIQRENHSLCYSTGQCKYEIPAANKSVHEGQYYCLVQQRNSRQIKRSLNLTVIPASGMADSRTKELLIVRMVIVVIAVVCM